MNQPALALILCSAAILGQNGFVSGEIPEFVVKEGEEVVLACPVNIPDCGEYHSLKWYRNTQRVYVFSQMAHFSQPEDSLMDRCFDLSQRSLGPACPRGSLEVTNNTADLKISPIKMTDDGEYRCEITYLAVSNNCPVVHLTNVRTVAPPTSIAMSVSGDPQSQSQSKPAGSQMSVSCISRGGKPSPAFTWYLGDQEILDHSLEVSQEDSLEVKSEVSFTLEEEHDGLEIKCLVENELSVEPLMDLYRLEVEVPVHTVSISPESVSGREEEEMTLSCRATGGPPAPRISWTFPGNGEHRGVSTITSTTDTLEDGSLEIVSEVIFTPVSTEDLQVVQCHAINDVMTESITTEAVLDIEYSPRVRISPENLTLLQGEEESLECQVSSNPANVSVVWFHYQHQLETDGEKYSEIVSDSDSDSDSRFLLIIRNGTVADSGEYSCSASNDLGTGLSHNVALIDVLYPPRVSVSSSVSSMGADFQSDGLAVTEESREEVRLRCEVESANPADLLSVTWYRDDQPLHTAPFVQCSPEEEGYSLYEIGEEGSGGQCTEVTLVDVSRSEAGLYSCVGSNIAGEGERSEPLEMIVHYSPGKSTVLQTDEFITKGSSANFVCAVEEPGQPENEKFLWQLGDTILEEISENLTLTNIGFESQQNLSCVAVNEIGPGESDSLQISVFAPPSFLTALPATMNVLSDDPDFSQTCQVECDPLCDLLWLREDVAIEAEDEMFEIIEEVLPEDPDHNVFVSVRSTLRKRGNTTFDQETTNFSLSCQVSGHQFGDSLSSSMSVLVEYPPEDINLTEESLEVVEGEELEPVVCAGSGSPPLSFYWTLREEVVAEGDTLTFLQPVERGQAGEYFCHGANKHGETLASLSLSVLHRPQCSLTYTFQEDEIILLCQASANPNEVTFRWDRGNETLSQPSQDGEAGSELRIEIQADSLGDYVCYVNNSIGESDPCSIQTQDILLKKEVGEQELVLIIVVVTAVVVLLLLLTLVTCYYFYRKSNKANDNSDKKEKKDEQPRPDKSFYENLPFEGLKSPPPKVISAPTTEDTMDYADADYKDLYVEGPKGYRKIPDPKPKLSVSKENVNGL